MDNSTGLIYPKINPMFTMADRSSKKRALELCERMGWKVVE